MRKLDEIYNTNKDPYWNLYVFNNIDQVNELTHLEKLFTYKIKLLQSGRRMDKKFYKLRKKYEWEANKFNLHIFLEDNFGAENPGNPRDIDNIMEILEEELEKIRKKIKEYKRAPAIFWLEGKETREKFMKNNYGDDYEDDYHVLQNKKESSSNARNFF